MYNLVKFLLELVDSITINNIYREFIPNVTNLVSEEISTQAGVVSFQFYFPFIVSSMVTIKSEQIIVVYICETLKDLKSLYKLASQICGFPKSTNSSALIFLRIEIV